MSYKDALEYALELARQRQGRVWIVETTLDGWQVKTSPPLLPTGTMYRVDDYGEITSH